MLVLIRKYAGLKYEIVEVSFHSQRITDYYGPQKNIPYIDIFWKYPNLIANSLEYFQRGNCYPTGERIRICAENETELKNKLNELKNNYYIVHLVYKTNTHLIIELVNVNDTILTVEELSGIRTHIIDSLLIDL